jgi:hypothetical protein
LNLNNHREVSGVRIWTRATGVQDLGTIQGDFDGAASGINDSGQIVGVPLDINFNQRTQRARKCCSIGNG